MKRDIDMYSSFYSYYSSRSMCASGNSHEGRFSRFEKSSGQNEHTHALLCLFYKMCVFDRTLLARFRLLHKQ